MSRTDNGPVGRTLPTKGASGGGRMAKVVKTRAWAVLGAVALVLAVGGPASPKVDGDAIKCMLGPYSSGLTKAIAPVTEKYRIPMVEGNGADRALFTQGYKYMFAVLSTSDQYLREAMNLAAQQARKQGN